MGVFLASLVLIMGVLYNYYSGLYDADIKKTAEYISNGMNIGGEEYLDGIKPANNSRITWIAADGTVKYDSKMAAGEMESHADREEFIKAKENGTGESLRYSNTLSEKTYNYAILLKDGTVLRASGTQFTIISLLLSMIQPILTVFVIAVVLSFVLANVIAKKIIKPINDIDFDDPKHIDGYEELSPLVDRLIMQNRQIDNQLEELSTEHEAQDKMRREFTANVSHELKTPLTSISGFAEIIRDGMVKPEDIPRFAGNIYDEAGRLITLVGDIIKISQLDEQNGEIVKEPIDLLDECTSVVTHLQPVAKKRGIEMTLTGEHIITLGAEQILFEMIYNICDNAIKYNKDNGKIDINLTRQNGLGVLSVKDTGIGIPKEDIDRVFERFYRVNKSHSKEIGGTGLGLSIVKHAAMFHDAKIEIESTLGVGTEIRVLFKEC